jgi:primase-polymerase (primpol)-like protein
MNPIPRRDDLPSELFERSSWVCWTHEKQGSRLAKPPLDPKTGLKADVSNPATWSTFDAAVACAVAEGYGVGFVFTEDDNFVGIDIDNCREPDNGLIESWAREILDYFDTYVETSPSGTGLHLIVRGVLNPNFKHVTSINNGKIEIYDKNHYFTVSGHKLKDSPLTIAHDQAALDTLLERYMPPKVAVTALDTSDKLDLPQTTDEDLLAKARKASNGSKFTRLWNGDMSDYANDQHRADLALCELLAYWSWLNADQIDRLFRQSKLYRPKWERVDYRISTITDAIAMAEPGITKVLANRKELPQANQPGRKPRNRKPRKPREPRNRSKSKG